ncbi:MAG: hypothetical protein U0694_13210 [Anaerolineae bacterium]
MRRHQRINPHAPHLWQQFSSNHSASFRIIGTFESEAKAADAAEELRAMLRTIAAFWQQLAPHERETWRNRLTGELTPPEIELSQHYNVAWSTFVGSDLTHGIDWIPADPDEALKALTVYERSLSLHNIGDTSIGSQPFERLLQKWGAVVVGWHEREGVGDLRAVLTCRAPSEEIAQRMMQEVIPHWGLKQAGQGKPIAYEVKGVFYSPYEAPVRDGPRLTYALDMWHFPDDLVSTIAYVTQYGCTDIHYTFKE